MKKGGIVMKVLIDNCFSWIGYHIANEMLEHGWYVSANGEPATEEEEHLAMFLGRNSCFSTNTTIGAPSAEIKIDCETAEQSVFVSSAGKECKICCSYLVGEWMPLANSRELYKGNEKEIVYIDELSCFLIQFLEGTILDKEIRFVSRLSSEASSNCSNIAVSLSRVLPAEKIAKVASHFNRFSHFYRDG